MFPYLVTPPFTTRVATPDGGTRSAPLVGVLRYDGLGNMACELLYSDHDGLDAVAPWADVFGAAEEDAAEVVRNFETSHGIFTQPIRSSRVDKSMLVWDVEPAALATMDDLIRAGIVEDTGIRLESGYNSNYPVLKVRKAREYVCEDFQNGPDEACYECNEKASRGRCSGCQGAQYCSDQCQRAAWRKQHKYYCKLLKASKAEAAAGSAAAAVG